MARNTKPSSHHANHRTNMDGNKNKNGATLKQHQEITKMEKVMDVYKTTDYKMFSLLSENRYVKPQYISNLLASLEIKQLIVPIIVNKNYEIIDGQHRFTAQMKKGLPIYFIICPDYGFQEVVMLNQNQRNWGLMDFHKHYIDIGSPHYVNLQEFMEQYNINLAIGLIFMTRGKDNYSLVPSFKKGQFVITPEISKFAHNAISKYNQIRNLWGFANHRTFVIAFIKALKHPDFKWKRFYDNLEKYHYKLEKRATSDDYLKLFQKIYNHGRHNKIRIYEEPLK